MSLLHQKDKRYWIFHNSKSERNFLLKRVDVSKYRLVDFGDEKIRSNTISYAKFDILTAVLLKIQVFWNVTLFWL
jgi:hypothetical protein